MAVAEILPQKVGVGAWFVDRPRWPVAPRASFVDLYVRGAPTVEPARDRVARQSQPTVDLGEGDTLGMQSEGLETQAMGVHAEIISRGYDNSGAPGGIRTHTVWCLRPSSLPVG